MDGLLLTVVLVQQARGIPIERVTLLLAWWPIRPLCHYGGYSAWPPRPLMEIFEEQESADLLATQPFRHERIPAETADMAEFARLTQPFMHEGQHLLDGSQVIVGSGQGMGQRAGQPADPVQRSQAGPERGSAGVG